MMTCRELAAALDDLIDGTLPPDRRQALASHLRECSDCPQVVRDARCTQRLLRRMQREQMPDPMKTTLLDELRRSRRPRSSARPATPPDAFTRPQPQPSHGNTADTPPDNH